MSPQSASNGRSRQSGLIALQTVAVGLVCIVVATTLALWLLSDWAHDRVLRETVPSPDRLHNALVLSLGEGDDPPYAFGVAIVQAQSSGRWSSRSLDFVFRGMCISHSVKWLSAHELSIECGGPNAFAKHTVEQTNGIAIRTIVQPDKVPVIK